MWWDDNYKRSDFRSWLGGTKAPSREIVTSKTGKYRSVLDVACGICLDYNKYQEEGVEIDYTGMDACEGLVQEAVERGIRAVKGDIINIPFEDESFEVVTARHILEHLPDFKAASKAIKEMARVAKYKVLVVFFMPLDKEVIGTDPALEGEVHLNRYDKDKITATAEKYGRVRWTQVGSENILEIDKKATIDRVVFLVGVTASGKTTTGRRMQKQLGWPLIETDEFYEGFLRDKHNKLDAVNPATWRAIPGITEDRIEWFESKFNTIHGTCLIEGATSVYKQEFEGILSAFENSQGKPMEYTVVYLVLINDLSGTPKELVDRVYKRIKLNEAKNELGGRTCRRN